MPHPIVKEWGSRIRAARTQQGITLPGLARLADVDQASLSRIENGIQGVADGTRIKIARALKISVDELFAYGSEPEREAS